MIMHYPYLGVESLISNNKQPSHPILHVPTTSTQLGKKRADSMTKPKWKIKQQEQPHTKEQARTVCEEETF